LQRTNPSRNTSSLVDFVTKASLPAIERMRAEKSLLRFLGQAWHVIEPATPYVHNWHIDLLSEYLTAVSMGEIRRLIINIPPRYMKSILTSVMWPCWTWTQNPHLRWLFASYSASLSIKHSLDRRSIIESDWYQDRWADKVALRKDQNQKTEFQNMVYGSMIATSVGGSVTGKGGDIIVIDDPLDPDKALSEAERTSANRWMDMTLSTRLNDKKTGAIVVIMQRLHDEDVTGHLMKKDTWEQISLESPMQRARTIVFPLSKRTKVLRLEEPLWEEKEPLNVLANQKIEMGTWAYAAQYLQSPAPLEGGLVKKDWFRFYKYAPIETMNQLIQSWDMTFKETKKGSFVTGQLWGRRDMDRFLLCQVRRRMGFVDTCTALKAMLGNYPQTQAVLIEDKANGPAVIDALKHEIANIIPISPKGSKEERLSVVSPQIESGHVYLPDPEENPWIDDYIHELVSFPSAAHDDQTDATSQALSFFPVINTGADTGFFSKGAIFAGGGRGKMVSSGMEW